MSQIPHLTLLVAGALGLAACSGRYAKGEEEGDGRATTLTIRGSDTMVILAQRWAEAFMEAHPDVAVQVSGGGSGTGIAALLNGTTDLATASRPLRDREREQLHARSGADALEIPVALDAVAVYVHEDNPIPELDVGELEAIFRGRVRGFREVGGDDRPIVLYGRENNSGTYAFFKERVLDDLDFAAETQSLPGTAAVIHAVSLDPNAIGYGGIAYGRGVRAVPLAASASETAHDPSLDNATSGAYPLSRYLLFCSAGTPSGRARDFVAFALSPEGQALVDGAGFYPLPHPEEDGP